MSDVTRLLAAAEQGDQKAAQDYALGVLLYELLTSKTPFDPSTLMVTAGAAVLTALVLGVVGSTWQAIRATRAEREQNRERQRAEENALKAAEANEAQQRQKAQARAYASDMNLVAQALAANNLGRARELLYRHIPEPDQKGLRGWEWRYLWRQCQSDVLVKLCQKTNSVVSLSVSHDGKWLAIGEEEHGGLSIWDVERRYQTSRGRTSPRRRLCTVGVL